jgi:hypothetical protein
MTLEEKYNRILGENLAMRAEILTLKNFLVNLTSDRFGISTDEVFKTFKNQSNHAFQELLMQDPDVSEELKQKLENDLKGT